MIEFLAEPISERENLQPSPLHERLNHNSSRIADVSLPASIRMAANATIPKTITIDIEDAGQALELTINSGLVAASPFGAIPNTNYGELIKGLFVKSEADWISSELRRSEANGGQVLAGNASRLSEQLPMDADRLSLKLNTTPTERRRSIRLIEPKTGRSLRVVSLSKSANLDGGKNLSFAPSLLQLIAEAYPPLDIDSYLSLKYNEQTLIREHTRTLSLFRRSPESEQAKALSQLQVQEALSALAREKPGRYYALPHPDFSAIRIHRLTPTGSEDIIELDLLEIISELGPDASPETCRSKDIELMPGDIVELPAHEDRLDQVWEGFAPNTAGFLEKALSYNIRFVAADFNETSLALGWKAPAFYQTKAGLIAVAPTGSPVNLRASNAVPSASSKLYKYGFWLAWIREGALIEEPRSAATMTSPSPRTRTSGRRVVLPPKNR